jgi:predicted negative regulator of RcsB-dependent stress response
MDWATFFRDYPAIIPAVTTLVGLVLGYLFGKWDSERKRKWELDDRKFIRHTEQFDAKIKEVLQYTEDMVAGNEKIYDILFSFILALKQKDNQEIDKAKGILSEVSNLTKATTRTVAGVAYFKDEQLSNAIRNLVPMGDEMLDEAIRVLTSVKNNETVDLNEALKRLSDLRQRTYWIAAYIRSRMDELAMRE